jgi:DNA-binding LacI/PurR family transcriptional regulator
MVFSQIFSFRGKRNNIEMLLLRPPEILVWRMPRKPTALALDARKRIIEAIRSLPKTTMLPTTRELGETYDLHPSTIFRLLRDLAAEGYVWQSPNGRFFPAGAQRQNLCGVPLCFIGREMWQWSRLYQEILEGISEVCSANGSALIFMAAPSLIQQRDPMTAPVYASKKQQIKALQSLGAAVPRGCAGCLFDHLWQEEVINQSGLNSGHLLQLLKSGDSKLDTVVPDLAGGARLVAEYLQNQNPGHVVLVQPFDGDSAVDEMMASLRSALSIFPYQQLDFGDIGKAFHMKPNTGKLFFVCPEDNTAHALRERIQASGSKISESAEVIATQGSGLLNAPAVRLRYDYRRLGRAAAAKILHGTRIPLIQASWIQ